MAIKLLACAVMCLVTLQVMVFAQDPNSCNVQAQQLRYEISLAAKNSGIEISSARLAVNRNIGLVRSDIKAQLRNLQIKASLATGPRAALCRGQMDLKLGQLTDHRLGLCYPDQKFKLFNQKIGQINNLKGAADLICNSCALDSTCVDEKIQDVKKQAGGLQEEISAGVADAEADSNDCVEKIGTSKLKIINDASANFDACLEDI